MKNEEYDLEGIDGNVYSVMGYVARCMRKEGKTKAEIDVYTKSAMSGDYNNALMVSIEMIDNLNNEGG